MYQEIPIRPTLSPSINWTLISWIGYVFAVLVLILIYRANTTYGVYSLPICKNGAWYVYEWARIKDTPYGSRLYLPWANKPLLKSYTIGRFNGLGWSLLDSNGNTRGSLSFNLFNSDIKIKLGRTFHLI